MNLYILKNIIISRGKDIRYDVRNMGYLGY